MKTVFITGATGNMGRAVLKEFLKRNEDFTLRILARRSKKNLKLLSPYSDRSRLEIVWGDLMRYEDVLKGVSGADYVIHMGGMVTPLADLYPEKTLKVNVTGAEYVVKAVKAQENRDEIGVIYIGSVAQSGSYYPPHHWGRVQDKLTPPPLDAYAVSKCISEGIFAESGLKKWVSIRQSAMLYPALLMKADDPVAFHVPFNGVLEWTTIEDTATAIVNACEEWVPASFWRGFYNLSSGPSFRMTNYEFEERILATISCPKIEKIFRPNWFATRSFHGYWFADGDRLEEILHFRENISCEEYFLRMKKQLPAYFRLTPLAPACLIRAFMKKVALSAPLGPLHWIKSNNQERIKAHFGSLEEWKQIPDNWEDFKILHPSREPAPAPLDFDPEAEITLGTLQQVASRRGGKCLASEFSPENIYKKVEWEKADGTRFSATPNSVLQGGHWDYLQE